jgi:hypothetical protein
MHRPFVEARASSPRTRTSKAQVDDSDTFDDAGADVDVDVDVDLPKACLERLFEGACRLRKITVAITLRRFKLVIGSQTKGPIQVVPRRKAIAYDHLPNSGWNSWISNGILGTAWKKSV